MKKVILVIALISLTSSHLSFAKSFNRVQSYQPVTARGCTLFVNMEADFPFGTDLSAFGGAGSDAALQNIHLISNLIQQRGYQIVANENDAAFKLKLSNGVQCVMTDGSPGKTAQWVIDNFDTQITASGQFSGRVVNGEEVENSAKRSFIGIWKKAHFRALVGQILPYCYTAE